MFKGPHTHIHTHQSNKSKSAHFETANAHSIQYGAGLTDGPSVFKAEGADLISKQVKPKRGRERETPLCRHGAKVLPALPPQLGLTSSHSHSLSHLFWLPGVEAGSKHTVPPHKRCNQPLFMCYYMCLREEGLRSRLSFRPSN